MYEIDYSYKIKEQRVHIERFTIRYTSNEDPDIIIKIPDNFEGYPVYSIGRNASQGKKIKEVYIPDEVEIIEDGAFFRTLLQNIRLPQNLKFIGDYAFSYTNMENIIIPKDVKYIGKHALEGVRNVYNLSGCDISLSNFGNITHFRVVNVYNANSNSRLNLDLDFYTSAILDKKQVNLRVHYHSVNKELPSILKNHEIQCDHVLSEERLNESINYSLFNIANKSGYENVIYYKDTNQLFVQSEFMFDVVNEEVLFKHYNIYHLSTKGILKYNNSNNKVYESSNNKKKTKKDDEYVRVETKPENLKGLLKNIIDIIKS